MSVGQTYKACVCASVRVGDRQPAVCVFVCVGGWGRGLCNMALVCDNAHGLTCEIMRGVVVENTGCD